jgi:lipoate-protein ligase A
MRRDLALLEAAESGQVGWRVYGWDGIWVSVGRFQSPERDLVDSSSTRWVLRPTGGKAVIHGHDVTVGLAVPLGLLDVDCRSIKSVYRVVVAPIVDALRLCGVDAALAEQTRYSHSGARTADCFAFSSPNDVVDACTGKKICGCALRLTQSAVLVQASIPNGPPLVDPATLIVNADRYSRFDWDSTEFCPAFEQFVRKLGLGAVA